MSLYKGETGAETCTQGEYLANKDRSHVDTSTSQGMPEIALEQIIIPDSPQKESIPLPP